MRDFGRGARIWRTASESLRRPCSWLTRRIRSFAERALKPSDPESREEPGKIARLERTVAELEAQLTAVWTLDLETGLPNRRSFIEQIRQHLDRREGWDAFWVVAARFQQLDRLRHSLGASAASRLMRDASARLHAVLGDGAGIARIADSELGLLLPASEALTTEELGRRLLAVIEDRFEVGGQGVYLHAVLGFASSIYRHDGASDLLDRAGLAADEAHANDQKCVTCREEAQEEIATLLQLETELGTALANREYRLHYQPIVSATEGAIVGFEALLRWQHASGTLILPEQFLPVAERAGYMTGIRDWVFETGLGQSKRWHQLLDPPVYISMNLTPRDLNPEFCGAILNMIDDARLPPECIGVEVTETAVVRDFRLAAELIGELSERGVRVLLDDFGTGYSSLSYLRELPFRSVQIDQSFIHRMGHDARDFGLVRSIVSLVHYLGMECVAEGLETQEQLELIAMIDCDYWQGKLFSEPVPAEQAEALACRRAPFATASTVPGAR